MNWKLKAIVQNLIALLPSRLSYELYVQAQLRWGSLRIPDHLLGLRIGVNTWSHLVKSGYDPRHKIFLEVGTGRKPIAPLAFWLMGADRIYTFDLNPYLREDLTIAAIRQIASRPKEVRELMGDFVDNERLESLGDFCRRDAFTLADILAFVRIEYHAPADAAHTALPARSIDVHTSYTVFEHIPGPIIQGIMHEARRLIKPDGVALHLIDYTDHFCHKDPSIHWLNFLRYSDRLCSVIFGNRYMYMNRLRHDDQLAIGREAGFTTDTLQAERDPAVGDDIARGRVKLAQRFRDKSVEILCIINAWVLYRPAATAQARSPQPVSP